MSKIPFWCGLTGAALLFAGAAGDAVAQNRQVSQQSAGRVVSQQEFAALEARVAALEKRLSASPSPATNISADKALWRRLQAGMKPDQVRALLGEPVQLDGGANATWYYSTRERSGPYVFFISGKVYSWEEPK